MKPLSIRCSHIAGISTPAEFYQKAFIHKAVQRDYFDIGTAAHAYILEPEKFKDLVIVTSNPPEPDKLNKDGSLSKTGKNGAYIKQIKQENPGKIVFDPVQYQNIVGYCESVMNIPGFSRLIHPSGLFEHSMNRTHETGIELTGTADYIKPGKFIADLKFVSGNSDREINASFYDYEYHVRAAFYLDLWNLTHEKSEQIDDFLYIVVSKSENPTARFIKLRDTDINAGRNIYEDRLVAIAKCHESGDWVTDSIESYDLPEWVYTKKTNF